MPKSEKYIFLHQNDLSAHGNTVQRDLTSETTSLSYQQASTDGTVCMSMHVILSNWSKSTKDSPGIVYFKNNFSTLLPFQACRVFKRGVQIEKIMNAEIESLLGVVPIKETKKKDLRAMMQYLDEENRLYFENILNA